MKTYQARKDGVLAIEFNDSPGRVTSTALLNESPECPFLSGHECAPQFGNEMAGFLSKSDSAEDFADRLRAAGYEVSQIDPLTGAAVQ
jgi:hypothetical protein